MLRQCWFVQWLQGCNQNACSNACTLAEVVMTPLLELYGFQTCTGAIWLG